MRGLIIAVIAGAGSGLLIATVLARRGASPRVQAHGFMLPAFWTIAVITSSAIEGFDPWLFALALPLDTAASVVFVEFTIWQDRKFGRGHRWE